MIEFSPGGGALVNLRADGRCEIFGQAFQLGDPSIWLTPAHCLDQLEAIAGAAVHMLAPLGYAPVRGIERHWAADLAVLFAPLPPHPVLEPLRLSAADAGVGDPIESAARIDGQIESFRASVVARGVVGPPRTNRYTFEAIHWLSDVVRPGYSGAAVLDETGDALAMVTGGMSRGDVGNVGGTGLLLAPVAGWVVRIARGWLT